MTDIIIQPGAARSIVLPRRANRHQVAVLSQPGALPIGQAIAGRLSAPLRLLPDGEAAKTLAVVEGIYEWLADLRLGRADTLVAVGGGTLTDAAGFVAATWLRGIEVVYVPTTLLAAVDAAIGGKTGINLRGKNLVGAFWPAALVVIDTQVLAALPESLIREGMAEVVKAGLIADPGLVDLIAQQGLRAPLPEVIQRAVAVKQAVVAEDPIETGRRMILNYGHTLGHAVEKTAGITHGQAVAIGMVAAGAVSAAKLGFPDQARQVAIIEGLGLPTTSPPVERSVVKELLSLDKKADGPHLRMVLLRTIGEPVVMEVDDLDVDTGLAAVGL